MGAASYSFFHHKVFGASIVEASVLPGCVQCSQQLKLWSGHHVRHHVEAFHMCCFR